jgi:hypothetical protein
MNHESELYEAIIGIIDSQEDRIVSTSLILNELKTNESYPDIHASNISDPVQDLIVLGEITLAWVQQSGRVMLNKSVDPGNSGQSTLVNGTWRCYIAENYESKYHSGLFETKNGAKEYLRRIAGDAVDNLEEVSFCGAVFTAEISGFEGYGTHRVVIRGEQIHHESAGR